MYIDTVDVFSEFLKERKLKDKAMYILGEASLSFLFQSSIHFAVNKLREKHMLSVKSRSHFKRALLSRDEKWGSQSCSHF